jgi:hypothetical protein
MNRRSSSFADQAKNFFTAWGTFFLPACILAVYIVWTVLEWWHPIFSSKVTPAVLSFLLVLGVAYIPREPSGYRDAGKRVVTLQEGFFGLCSVATITFAVLDIHKHY